MRALLVHPRYPETFWGFQRTLEIVGISAALPPLGLLTIAAMLPAAWEKRLVDLNVRALGDEAIDWADIVLIGAMTVQEPSAIEVIARCRARGKRVVAGGPHYFHFHAEAKDVDHIIVGEAEEVMPLFLADLAAGCAKPVYHAPQFPDVMRSPLPDWSLVRLEDYHALSLQFSRGCPFDCEFCDIITLNGRKPRVKAPERAVAELEALYRAGWCGEVFIVDDNFYGNKKRCRELLEAIAAWREMRGRPFTFLTQATLNIADEDALLDLMVRAGFDRVFIGLESPSPASLAECSKVQNLKRDMARAIGRINACGIEAMGGFIIGFDSDSETIFDEQVAFIEETGIPIAMVGLLMAGPHTRLYDRMRAQGRILWRPTGNNVGGFRALNFRTKMDRARIIEGYKSVLTRLYEPAPFTERALRAVDIRRRANATVPPLQRRHIRGLANAIWRLGIRDEARRHFWRLFWRGFRNGRAAAKAAVDLALMGYHLRELSRGIAQMPDDVPELDTAARMPDAHAA